MHLITLYGHMLTGHFHGIDKEDLIQDIGRQMTGRIAEDRAHTESLSKLSPAEKKRGIAENIDSLRAAEQELVHLVEQHHDWHPGAHALLAETASEAFSAAEAVYLLID